MRSASCTGVRPLARRRAGRTRRRRGVQRTHGGEDPRDFGEHEIAGEVAAPVVDLFEVVDIADHHSPTAVDDVFPRVSLPSAAVGEPVSSSLPACSSSAAIRAASAPDRDRAGAAVFGWAAWTATSSRTAHPIPGTPIRAPQAADRDRYPSTSRRPRWRVARTRSPIGSASGSW